MEIKSNINSEFEAIINGITISNEYIYEATINILKKIYLKFPSLDLKQEFIQDLIEVLEIDGTFEILLNTIEKSNSFEEIQIDNFEFGEDVEIFNQKVKKNSYFSNENKRVKFKNEILSNFEAEINGIKFENCYIYETTKDILEFILNKFDYLKYYEIKNDFIEDLKECLTIDFYSYNNEEGTEALIEAIEKAKTFNEIKIEYYGLFDKINYNIKEKKYLIFKKRRK